MSPKHLANLAVDALYRWHAPWGVKLVVASVLVFFLAAVMP